MNHEGQDLHSQSAPQEHQAASSDPHVGGPVHDSSGGDYPASGPWHQPPPPEDIHEPVQPSYDDLNTPIIALVGFVSGVITLICIIGLQAAYLQYSHAIEQQNVYNVRLDSVNKILAEQQMRISGYEWVDREKNLVSMPIEDAMADVVKSYESKSRQ